MKKCYLDSNILVYFKDDLSPFRSSALQILSQLRTNGVKLFLSPLVMDEFIYAFKYGLQAKKTTNLFANIRRTLRDVLTIPSLAIINPPEDPASQLKIVDMMEKYTLNPREAYHLLIMLYHGIDGFATFDSDFTKVFSAKVLEKAG